MHKRLRYHNYKFLPSQTDVGQEYINEYNLSKISNHTIVLIKNKNIFTKSDAMLEIIDDLPIIWSLFKILRIVPRKLRNWFYDIISKNRHFLFGKIK